MGLAQAHPNNVIQCNIYIGNTAEPNQIASYGAVICYDVNAIPVQVFLLHLMYIHCISLCMYST